MMRIPDDPGQVPAGYAGKAGRPVRVSGDARAAEMRLLRSRLVWMQVEIDRIRQRLACPDAGSGMNAPGGADA